MSAEKREKTIKQTSILFHFFKTFNIKSLLEVICYHYVDANLVNFFVFLYACFTFFVKKFFFSFREIGYIFIFFVYIDKFDFFS